MSDAIEDADGKLIQLRIETTDALAARKAGADHYRALGLLSDMQLSCLLDYHCKQIGADPQQALGYDVMGRMTADAIDCLIAEGRKGRQKQAMH